MFHRNPAPLPFAAAAMSFAAGALLVFAVSEAVQRRRLRQPHVSDDVVARNVRERLGHIVTRPEAVEVSVENGVVRLAGSVPAEERDELLTQLLWLPGVVRVRNALGTR